MPPRDRCQHSYAHSRRQAFNTSLNNAAAGERRRSDDVTARDGGGAMAMAPLACLFAAPCPYLHNTAALLLHLAHLPRAGGGVVMTLKLMK